MEKKMNPVTYFEIPVKNMERAVKFYEFVFECTLERQSIDGNDMALFPFQESAHGASGALAKGESYVPSKSGSRLYFSVKSIDSTLSKVAKQNGRMLYPKTDIGAYGFVAEFEDCEGNCIALHEQRAIG
jgi:uncharacterized protein